MNHFQQIAVVSLILGFAFGLLTGTLVAMFIIERPFNYQRKNKMVSECPICKKYFQNDQVMILHWLQTKKHASILKYIKDLERKNKMVNNTLNAIELWALVRAHGEVLSKMDMGFSTQAMLWRVQRLSELAQMIQDLETQSENKPE